MLLSKYSQSVSVSFLACAGCNSSHIGTFVPCKAWLKYLVLVLCFHIHQSSNLMFYHFLFCFSKIRILKQKIFYVNNACSKWINDTQYRQTEGSFIYLHIFYIYIQISNYQFNNNACKI